MKYTLSYKTKFGTLSAESENPDDLLIGYQTLKQLLPRFSEVQGVKSRKSRPRPGASPRKLSTNARGRGETASIIRELESRVLPGSFFSRPRTTGETRDKLLSSSGHSFTSRKVSQALGILWKKGVLRRSGSRNYYAYSK